MTNLKKDFKVLEMNVHNKLRAMVKASQCPSKHTSQCTAIQIDCNGMEELIIVDDKLTFVDGDGMYYSIFTQRLECLVDIIYN